jgi:hypothetical protein
MKKIYFLLVLLLTAYCLFANPLKAGAKFSLIAKPPISQVTKSNYANYIYVRVFEEGAWWIYVYDIDGVLIDKYIDPTD